VTVDGAVFTALAAGALGSAHCAAMCGPLAVAGCSRGRGVATRDAAGYFGGRLVAYATVGAVLGHLGRHALCILPMAALETVAIAAVAIAAAYRGVWLLRPPSPPKLVPLRGKPRGLFALLADLWPRRGIGLGLATAVMPCSLLVPAWALAAGTASAASGALVMAAFSVATLPGLLVPLAGRQLLQRATTGLPRAAHGQRSSAERLGGLAWCVLAAWIAVRPLLVVTGACHF
jgi:sulfite exporter TauE/SafE